jgi:general L-amino acid transport system substrate-binding protein
MARSNEPKADEHMTHFGQQDRKNRRAGPGRQRFRLEGNLMRGLLLTIASGVAAVLLTGAAQATTLQDVKARGYLQCGVNTGQIGFSVADDKGVWTGFDVDYCRAVAAAVFNDPGAVHFLPLTARERFTALQSGQIDLLARNTTWTMSRDTSLDLMFAGANYYDGQGFMVRKSLGVTSALQLGGATICVQTGTTDEINLADYFKRNNMQYTPVTSEKADATLQAYQAGHCDAYTTQTSSLYASRLGLAKPDDHIILPEIISKEPLGLVVRQGDDQWFNIVRWTGYALLDAEELGVTSKNVDEMKDSDNQDIRRLLGTDGTFGESIGLKNDWAAGLIKAVGNYGEIFDRDLGADSPLKIARGLNALWTTKGGIQYGIPIR